MIRWQIICTMASSVTLNSKFKTILSRVKVGLGKAKEAKVTQRFNNLKG